MSAEKKEKRLPIQIAFGQVFEHIYKRHIAFCVITDVGSDNWCYAAPIVLSHGKITLRSPGTIFRKDIDNIVGQWSLEQMISATMNYYGDSETTRIICDVFRESSLVPPRLLK